MPVSVPFSQVHPVSGAVYAFRIPGRFDPGYSPLGRLVRRRIGDALRAEAVFILTLAGAALSLLFAHYAVWLWLREVPSMAAGIGGPMAVRGIQAGLTFVVAVLCLLGFRSPIMVECRRNSLAVRQGRRVLEIPYGEITSASPVTGLAYYRHYRRYSETASFVNTVGSQVMLLHTPDRVVALGLSERDGDALAAMLQEQRESTEAKLRPAAVATEA